MGGWQSSEGDLSAVVQWIAGRSLQLLCWRDLTDLLSRTTRLRRQVRRYALFSFFFGSSRLSRASQQHFRSIRHAVGPHLRVLVEAETHSKNRCTPPVGRKVLLFVAHFWRSLSDALLLRHQIEMDVAKKSRRPPDEDLEETSHFNSPSQGFFYLFLHLIISTLWTRLLPHLAQSSSCVTLLAFPFLHFATLLVGFTWALRRTKGETAEDVMRWSSVVLLGRKAYSEGMYGKDRDRRRSLVRWTATSLVVSLLLHLWGSRWMIDREMEALDVSSSLLTD